MTQPIFGRGRWDGITWKNWLSLGLALSSLGFSIGNVVLRARQKVTSSKAQSEVTRFVNSGKASGRVEKKVAKGWTVNVRVLGEPRHVVIWKSSCDTLGSPCEVTVLDSRNRRWFREAFTVVGDGIVDYRQTPYSPKQ